MRVLWVCNIMLPFIARKWNLPASNKEGWLTGIVERVMHEADRLQLAVCFPTEDGSICPKTEIDGIMCYAFTERVSRPELYDDAMEGRFAQIIEDFQPDILHCFGTEFGHTLAALRAFGKPERSLVGIQGLCAACADAYMADLPEYVRKRSTFRDVLKNDNLEKQRQKFVLRGKRENEILRLTGNITGRTAFDRRETEAVNPKSRYFFMNETLRSCFYDGRWEWDACEKHAVFVSQGNYPLKGLHYVLQAMPELLVKYPDCKLYVAGDVITAYTTWKEKIKISSYGKYLLELIKKYRLHKAVVFLGKQGAEQMKARFLQSHVYVLASSLENSPNSLGEAMLLGVPCVASEVGGVPDMLNDNTEGLLYPAGDAAAMTVCISRIFDDRELAERLSAAAVARAAVTHNADKNYQRLTEIYKSLMER